MNATGKNQDEPKAVALQPANPERSRTCARRANALLVDSHAQREERRPDTHRYKDNESPSLFIGVDRGPS